jgi:RNA polymerase sigma factor (sigma-70 family)
MPDKGMNRVVQHLFKVARGRAGGELTDGQLLESFLAKREEAVFEAMVHRHGPMVLAVCRRVLGHVQDAEDAFQGAFLVLLRKAGGIHPREKVADWLYGVTCRVALKARVARQRRLAREKPLSACHEPQASEPNRDWLPLLDRELQALPAKYRLPIILCDLEGKSARQAAGQLGWREGTLSGRLCRGRALLCRRLSRRGFTLSVAGLAAGVSAQAASVKVPAALAAATVKAASFVGIKEAATAGAISAQAAFLAEGVIKTMFISNLKTCLVSVLALVIVATGLGRALYTASGQVEGQAPGGKGNAPKVVRGKAPSAKEKDLDNKLQAPGDFTYNDQLRTILNKLSEEKGINVFIDPSANINPGNPEGDSPLELGVSLQLRDVPLETAFRYLMEAGKLGYFKQDGVLVVTSKQKSMVRKVYAVETLAGDKEERNVPALITAIIHTIEPGTWWLPPNQKMFNPFQGGAALPNGGTAPIGDVTPAVPVSEGGQADITVAGTIAYFPATKALVVRHCPEVHREIEELLAKLAEK